MTQARLTELFKPSDSTLSTHARPLLLTDASGAVRSNTARPIDLPPRATSTEGATPVLELETSPVQEADAVLAEVRGIVVGEAGENVMVRFEEQNLTVHFPRELVPEDLELPGACVMYQIVRRPSGMRYQRFVAREAEVDQTRVDAVLEQLAKIRYRAK